MSVERLKILKMVEEGKITPEEGDRLLTALGVEETVGRGAKLDQVNLMGRTWTTRI